MSSDLVSRLRVEATANVDAVAKTEQAVASLGDTAQKTAANLNQVADAAGKADQASAAAAESAKALGEGLQAANDAGEKAAESVGKGKEAIDAQAASAAKGKAAMDDVAEANRGAGVAAAEAAGAFLGGVVATAALAAGAALVGAGFAALREELGRAEAGADAAREALERLQENARETADLVAHLADETRGSADAADLAAGGYDRQALAVQNLNQKLREMNALELVSTIRESDERLHNIDVKIRRQGVIGAFTSDDTERAANTREALLRELGFSRQGDLRLGDAQAEERAIAQAVAGRKSLNPGAGAALKRYLANERELTGTVAARQAEKDFNDAALRQLYGEDDDVTLLDELVVEAPTAKKGRKTAATEEERDAKRRLDAARQMRAAYNLETEALAARAKAAMEGEEALEALRVKEAGLRVLERQGVESLGELTGKVREQTAAAIGAAEAAERQAIAAEKAERVGAASRNLDRAIASEQRRAQAIAGGTLALTAFNQAEDIRQSVEAVGLTLTAEQVALLEEKELKLAQIAAANDNADFYRQQAEELRLLELTNEERDLEERKLRIRNELLLEGKEIVEAEVEARALLEQGAYQNVAAIRGLKEDLRQAFIETGELSFDSVADYAEQKLREAVYNALLAEPIEVFIKAVVGDVSGASGLLGSLLGGSLGSILGSSLVGSSVGGAIGQSLGLGTGKAGTDQALSLAGGLGGTLLAGSAASVGLAGAVTGGALSLGAGATLAGGLGALLSSAAVLGPLGAIAGLALGTLFKDDQRPYARADIGVVGGEFAVTGSQSLDGGPVSEMEAAAAQITESLNAAADLFKLDLTKVSNLPTSIGYVQGKNTGALSEGYFGGDGGGFSTGAQFEGYTDASALAEDIVRATIIRAIEAGASDLSEAEKRVVTEAADLEEAANKIALGRSITETIDDAILQLTDPAAFERQEALDAIEESYQALKAQAEELIAAGLVSGDVLTKLDELKALQIDESLANLGGTAAEAEAALREAWDREVSSLTAHAAELERSADALAAERRNLTIGAAAGLSPEAQYEATKSEYERVKGLALAGDDAAAAELPSVMRDFEQASRAYYASSAGYFRDVEDMRATAEAVEVMLRSEADTLLQQLEVQKESLKTLIAINDNIVSLPQAIADLINAKAADGTLDTSSAELPAWFDWEVYGANNPDLLKARAAGTALTEFGSDREALEQHYLRIGKNEIADGTRYYAAGGVFTNQVVSSPTSFDIGVMAEAGPEAIMPLFMGPRGLGVVAVSNDNGRTEALLAAVLVHLEALVVQGGAAATAQLAELRALADEIAANTRALAAA